MAFQSMCKSYSTKINKIENMEWENYLYNKEHIFNGYAILH